MSEERNVVVHYHLFKNAGTSADRLLQKNFGERWMGFDGNSAGDVITTEELERTINDNPDKVAFSSHQIVPPLPEIAGQVFPIVFLRDPIDRIKSAYLFEWQKQLRLEEPKGSLAEYVSSQFKHQRKSAIEEFQTIRLSNHAKDRFTRASVSDEKMLEQACEFIASLPFIGIVDQFDASVALLEGFLKPVFPDFKSTTIKANILQDISASLDTKREKIHAELGDELYEMIVSRNSMDQKLYEFGVNHFNSFHANATAAVG